MNAKTYTIYIVQIHVKCMCCVHTVINYAIQHILFVSTYPVTIIAALNDIIEYSTASMAWHGMTAGSTHPPVELVSSNSYDGIRETKNFFVTSNFINMRSSNLQHVLSSIT